MVSIEIPTTNTIDQDILLTRKLIILIFKDNLFKYIS